ncbi:hypothetical protein F01_260311 [Burkholderia cenocepacia]|nr:hypothetical protein F01_260311 [Burkholderia cenocepacia]
MFNCHFARQRRLNKYRGPVKPTGTERSFSDDQRDGRPPLPCDGDQFSHLPFDSAAGSIDYLVWNIDQVEVPERCSPLDAVLRFIGYLIAIWQHFGTPPNNQQHRCSKNRTMRQRYEWIMCIADA